MSKVVSTELLGSYDRGDQGKGFGISWVKQYDKGEFIFPMGWGQIWYTVDANGMATLDNEGLNQESVNEVMCHFAKNTGFDEASMWLIPQYFVSAVTLENP